MAVDPILDARPAAHFVTDAVQPPGALYVTKEDFLAVACWNSVAGAALAIRWRMILPTGKLVTDSQILPLTSARALNAQLFPLTEGYLLSVTVSVSGAVPKRGQTFVQVGIARGTLANPEQGAVLISDYCTNLDFSGWPGHLLRSPLEGPGVIRSITGTNPAAGAEILETVPTNARWQLRSVRFTIVTNATVANRTPIFTFDDGAAILFKLPSPFTTPASQTQNYGLIDGNTPAQNASGDNLYAVPKLFPMMAGWRFGTTTTALQAGDDYSAPQYVVEEWIEI